MATNKTPDFFKMVKGFKQLYRQLPTIAGGRAVVFFKASFRRQGWVENGRINKWVERKRAEKGRNRNVLVKSGRLRRSVRVVAKGYAFVRVGSDVPYAQIHNEGGVVNTRVRIPQHKRKAYERRVRGKRQRVRATKVAAHTKNMKYTMPERRYIGYSPDVMRSVEREYIRKFKDIIRRAS